MDGLIAAIKRLFNKEEPKRDVDMIPPGAPVNQGIGPDYVADTIANQQPPQGVATRVGDPFAPTMGVNAGGTQWTHQEVIDGAENADPRVNPSHPEKYWQQRDRDDSARHSAQNRSSVGWQTPVTDRVSFVPATRPASDRWTGYAHPELDSQTVVSAGAAMEPRELTGIHMSLADHRRDYEIYGQVPVKRARNTYRLEPTPWDADIIDSPAQDQIPVQAEIEVPATVQNNYMGNRTYRMGG